MMRRLHILLVTMLMMSLLVGCSREILFPEDAPVLGIYLEMPAPALVKATVPGDDAENALYDLKVWVFRADESHALVSSLQLDASISDGDFPQPGSVKRYSLPVSWDFALETPRPKVDVYVLANSASVGLGNLNADRTHPENVSSWNDVHSALFEGNNCFSTKHLISSVPDSGLPMSGVARNLDISGDEPSFSIAPVALERCVSKLRFLFCQMETIADTPEEAEIFQIDKIVLNSNCIPLQEYVFAWPQAPRTSGTYETATELPGAEVVASSDTPELYAYAGQDGSSYERVVSEALTAGKLTQSGCYYLRESGNRLSGVIHYTVIKGKNTASEETRHEEKTFIMPEGTDFSRNHTWTVYGYYVSKRSLQLSVSVLPWKKSDYLIDFGRSSLMVTRKLSVLQPSVYRIEEVPGVKDHYNVTLKSNSPASAYLYVATPSGGRIQLVVNGEQDGAVNAFDVRFVGSSENNPHEIDIDPYKNNGRLDITIDRTMDEAYIATSSGKSITLSFKAFTQDEREIDGASDCIDQVYHFILP